MVDFTKVYFITSSNVDKIAEEGTFSAAIGAGSPSSPATSTQTQAHTVGASVWVNGQVSIDGTNYYPLGLLVEGAVDGGSGLRQYHYCYAYASATTVSIYMENAYTSGKTFSVRYALELMS